MSTPPGPLLDPMASDRCRALARNLRVLSGCGQEKLFAGIIHTIGRMEWWRLMDVAIQRPWPLLVATWLAHEAQRQLSICRSEVLDHLQYPFLSKNAQLVELTGGEVFRENTRNLGGLALELQDKLQSGKNIISCQRVKAVGQMTDNEITADLVAQRIDENLSPAAEASKREFAFRQQRFHLEHHNHDQQHTYGFLREGFQDLESCSGRYRYLAPDQAHEGILHLRHVFVKEQNLGFRMIGQLPPDLAQWMGELHNVVAIDNNFLMKKARSGTLRVFLRRGLDGRTNYLLDQELDKLRRTLEYLTHDPSKDKVLKLLDRYAVNIEEASLSERKRHLAKRRGEPI